MISHWSITTQLTSSVYELSCFRPVTTIDGTLKRQNLYVQKFVHPVCSQLRVFQYSKISVNYFLLWNPTLRRSFQPAGRTTCASGPRSRSWLTCWRNCPSSTAGSRTLDTSGNLQSMYRRTETQGHMLNLCQHLLHPASPFARDARTSQQTLWFFSVSEWKHDKA